MALMRFVWGRWIGALLGSLWGGFGGALIGFILGFLHDKRREAEWVFSSKMYATERSSQSQHRNVPPEQSAFTLCVIVLGAKMAKADGHVSREEIAAFRRVFRIPDDQVEEVGRLFNRARANADGYEPYAAQLASLLSHDPLLLEEVLTGLFSVAVADKEGLSRGKTAFLRRVAVLFGFSEADFVRIAARSGVYLADKPRPAPREDSYSILGLPSDASDADIKKTYRVLIRKHHPDKLIAQGLPKELVEQATEKMKRLNAAYDVICKDRGMK